MIERTCSSRVHAGILALVCVGSVVGCSGGYETAEVKGTVTLDGKPASGMMIEFAPIVPRGEEQPPLAYGFTDANGAYVARSRRAKPGAVVGMSRVAFYPVEGGPPVPPGRTFGEEVLEREVKSGSNTMDFPLESKPRKP